MSSNDRDRRIALAEKRRRKRMKRLQAKRQQSSTSPALKVQPVPDDAVVLRAPEVLALTKKDSHRTIARFIANLKTIVLRDDRPACIDFSRTEKIHPDGLLLLYSEIDALLRLKPGYLSCKRSGTRFVNEVFQHLGFFKMIGHKSNLPLLEFDSKGWNVVKGRSLDFTAVGPVFERMVDDGNVAPFLFKGLQEAGANVAQHAYLAERGDGHGSSHLKGSWWGFFRTNLIKRRFEVLICDLGIGIPRTIETALSNDDPDILYGMKLVKVLALGTVDDAELIKAAVMSKKSRTGNEWRGKGLGRIRGVLEMAGSGSLYIMSNSGGYKVTRKTDSSEEDEVFRFSESIYGTILMWSVPITDK